MLINIHELGQEMLGKGGRLDCPNFRKYFYKSDV